MLESRKTRSLADRVFISPNSFAGDPFNKRDENKREELMSHIIANGDTQDMLRYISDKKKKVILVTIDYAGLTTNCEDMKSFLSTYSTTVFFHYFYTALLPFLHKCATSSVQYDTSR